MTYPNTLDNFINPNPTDKENVVSHSSQHSQINDAVEALEAKVGVNSSAVNTTHDFKLQTVATGDKAASLSGTETLTNKTLTSPKINIGGDATGDMYYRNSSGGISRIAAGNDGDVLNWDNVTHLPKFTTNPAASNGSQTVKGVYESATDAEIQARTATGGTGASLIVTTQTLPTLRYHDYAASGVGNDSYAISVTPTPTSYTIGDEYVFKADVSNSGAATLDVNGLGAKSIKKFSNVDLSDGDIKASQVVSVIYDGTSFQLQTSQPTMMIARTINVSSGVTSTTFTHSLGVIPRFARFRCIAKYSTGASQCNGIVEFDPATGNVVRQNHTAFNYNTSGAIFTFYNSTSAIYTVDGSLGNMTGSVGTTTSSQFTITHSVTTGTAFDIYVEVMA